jgi:hypothetical protein
MLDDDEAEREAEGARIERDGMHEAANLAFDIGKRLSFDMGRGLTK